MDQVHVNVCYSLIKAIEGYIIMVTGIHEEVLNIN